MIGILGSVIDSYSLIKALRRRYKKVDICISLDNINYLNKECKLIIILNDYNKTNNNISYYRKPQSKEYSLKDDKLLELIDLGKEKEIISYLKNIKIPKDNIILLNHPKLLYIKDIIKNIYNNPIIDRTNELLEEIDIIKKKSNISFSYNDKLSII